MGLVFYKKKLRTAHRWDIGWLPHIDILHHADQPLSSVDNFDFLRKQTEQDMIITTEQAHFKWCWYISVGDRLTTKSFSSM